MGAMACQTCSKFDEARSEKEQIQTCGRCKQESKRHMAERIREMHKVYIDENNVGRRPKSLNATQRNDIYYSA